MTMTNKTNNSDGNFTVKGLDEAEVVLLMTRILSSTDAGGDYIGGTRVDIKPAGSTQNRKPVKQPSNSEIIDYLAEGGRDIRPSDKEKNKANLIIANEIVKQMNRVGMIANNKKKTAQQQVKAGLAGGIRKAMKYLAGQIIARVKSQSVTGGGAAPRVTEKYAEQRNKGYGVANNVVFIRTKQLASALNNGIIKVRINTSKIGGAVRSITNSTLNK